MISITFSPLGVCSLVLLSLAWALLTFFNITLTVISLSSCDFDEDNHDDYKRMVLIMKALIGCSKLSSVMELFYALIGKVDISRKV